MSANQSDSASLPSQLVIVLAILGAGLFLIGAFLNWGAVARQFGFPAVELVNPFVLREVATIKLLFAETGLLVLVAAVLLIRFPSIVAQAAGRAEALGHDLVRTPASVFASLTGLVGATAALQLALYLGGYASFGADDFTRALRADYWLHHRGFDVGWGGWLGMVGGGWLPFQDYLVGLALAAHRDLYVTPRVVNLVVSATSVIVAYFLGRELFGKTIGLATAALFAVQPWRIWLGMSGMTSD